MQKVFPLFFLLLLIGVPLHSISQSTDTTFNGKTLLTKKWKLIYIEGSVNRVTIPESDGNFITFKSDGTYNTHSRRFKKVKGSWTYEEPTKVVLTTRQSQTIYKILHLTASELIMEGDAAEKHIRYTYHAQL